MKKLFFKVQLLLLFVTCFCMTNHVVARAEAIPEGSRVRVDWAAFHNTTTPSVYHSEYFDSLKAALASLSKEYTSDDFLTPTQAADVTAEDAPTLVLLEDILCAEEIEYDSNRNLNVNLNGYSLYFDRFAEVYGTNTAKYMAISGTGSLNIFGEVGAYVILDNVSAELNRASIPSTVAVYGGEVILNNTALDNLLIEETSSATGTRTYTSKGLTLTITGNSAIDTLTYNVSPSSSTAKMLSLKGGYYKVDPNTFKTHGSDDLSAYVTISNSVEEYESQEDWEVSTTYKYRVVHAPVEYHTISVVGGYANTTSETAGSVVRITANEPATGKVFVNWTASPEVEFDSATSPSTMFTSIDKDVTITANFETRPQATMTTIPTAASNLVYTGEKQALLSSKGVSSTSVVQFKLDDGNWISDEIPAAINAGTYNVSYRAAATSDYSSGNTSVISVTIDPQPIEDPEIEVLGGPFVYTGKEITPKVKVTKGKFELPTTEYVLSYKNNIKAGTATIEVKSRSGSNYYIKESVDFEIVGTDPSVEFTPPTTKTLVYTGAMQELITPGKVTDGTMKYSYYETTGFTTTVPKGCDAGDYDVWYLVEDKDGEVIVEATKIEGVTIAKSATVNVLYRTIEVPLELGIATTLNLNAYFDPTATLTITNSSKTTDDLSIDSATQTAGSAVISVKTSALSAGTATLTVKGSSANCDNVTVTIPFESKAKATESYVVPTTGFETPVKDITTTGLSAYTAGLSDANVKVTLTATPLSSTSIPTDRATRFNAVLATVYPGMSTSAIGNDYVSLDITKHASTDTMVTDTGVVVELAIKYDLIDKNNITVLREHDNEVTAFTELSTKPTSANMEDATFYLDRVNNMLYVYSSLFSVYSVAYTSTDAYKVHFDSAGGSTVPDMIVTGTSTVTTLPTPVKLGCNFLGWFTASTGGTQVTTISGVTADVTYYAHWSDDIRPVPTTPSAPTLKSKTSTSITVNVISGQVYSIDNGVTWQETGVFAELTPSTSYSIVTKILETTTAKESAVSTALTVKTDNSSGKPSEFIYDLSDLAEPDAGIDSDLTLTVELVEDTVTYNGKQHVSADAELSKSAAKKKSADLYIDYSALPDILKLKFVYKKNVDASDKAYFFPKLSIDKSTFEYRYLTSSQQAKLARNIRKLNSSFRKKINRIYFTIAPVELYYAEQTSKVKDRSQVVFTDSNNGKLVLELNKKRAVRDVYYKFENKKTYVSSDQLKITVRLKGNNKYTYTVKGLKGNFIGTAYGETK